MVGSLSGERTNGSLDKKRWGWMVKKSRLVRCGYLYVQGKGSEMTKRVVLFISLVSFVLGPFPSHAQTRSPDFDGNGKVDFEDFFLFAAVFGSRAPADLAKYDLDNGGLVDLEDFFMFAQAFGETVSGGTDSLLVTAPGDTMLLVPSGEFTMGSDSGENDERPIHQVLLDSFYVDKFEVTNAHYIKFLNEIKKNTDANGNQLLELGDQDVQITQAGEGFELKSPEFADRPVVEVSWYGARAYCEWADKKLPTEAEWEKAARGTDGGTYPWGDEEPDDRRLNFNSNVDRTTDVGRYPDGVSPYGLHDMSGNVWEWVNTKNQGYPYRSTDGREEFDISGDIRIIRGGGYLNDSFFVRAANRGGNFPENTDGDIGFRCIRSQGEGGRGN